MLANNLQEDLKQAQLTRDEIKVSTLRLLLSEIKNAEIALRQGSGQASITDDQVVTVIQREVKRRIEAAAGFRQGDREEQARKEEDELKILQEYLPSQLSNDQLTKIVTRAINEVGANSLQDLGKVMSAVMGKVAGRADGGIVNALVRKKLL